MTEARPLDEGIDRYFSIERGSLETTQLWGLVATLHAALKEQTRRTFQRYRFGGWALSVAIAKSVLLRRAAKQIQGSIG